MINVNDKLMRANSAMCGWRMKEKKEEKEKETSDPFSVIYYKKDPQFS